MNPVAVVRWKCGSCFCKGVPVLILGMRQLIAAIVIVQIAAGTGQTSAASRGVIKAGRPLHRLGVLPRLGLASKW